MIAPNQSPSARRFRKERDLSSSWTEPSPGICAWTLMASRPMTSSKAETACGGATHGPWVVVQRPQPGALNERLCLPRRTRSFSADTAFPICACSICWRNVNSSGETWLSSRAATSWPATRPLRKRCLFPSQQDRKLRRQGAFPLDPFPGHGMAQPHQRAVQGKASGKAVQLGSVKKIARYGTAQRG